MATLARAMLGSMALPRIPLFVVFSQIRSLAALTPLPCRIACHQCIYVAQLGHPNLDVGIDGEILRKITTRTLDCFPRGVRLACVVTRGLTVVS